MKDLDEKITKEIREIDRQEYNNYQRECRKHISLNSALEYGIVQDEYNLDLETRAEIEHLRTLYPLLTSDQKNLVYKVFYQRMDLNDIATEYGTSYQAVQNKLKKILAKLKKNF